MADNYLENKMDEHRRRMSAPRTGARSSYMSLPPHSLVTSYPELRVIIPDASTDTGVAMVEAFRSIDSKVDFAMLPGRTASELAQRTGSRFHPLKDRDGYKTFIRRVIADRGGADIIAGCGTKAIPGVIEALAERCGAHKVVLTGISPDAINLPCDIDLLTLPSGISPKVAAALALLFVSPAMESAGSLTVSQISCG